MWRLRQWLKRLLESWKSVLAAAKARQIKRQWDKHLRNWPLGNDGKRLLHIGCGDIDAPGFINLDARPKPHVHLVTTDLFRLSMIPDDAVDLIYMSHVLEHVSHREMVTTLREMRRILKDGGVLRISVPDFEHVLAIYEANGRDISAIEQPLMGGQDYPFNYHYAVFNDAYLRARALQSGFKETRGWDPRNCEYHDFEDWASMTIPMGGRDFPISLNIEAIK